VHAQTLFDRRRCFFFFSWWSWSFMSQCVTRQTGPLVSLVGCFWIQQKRRTRQRMQFRGMFASTTANKWGLGHGRPSVHPDVGHAVEHHGARVRTTTLKDDSIGVYTSHVVQQMLYWWFLPSLCGKNGADFFLKLKWRRLASHRYGFQRKTMRRLWWKDQVMLWSPIHARPAAARPSHLRPTHDCRRRLRPPRGHRPLPGDAAASRRPSLLRHRRRARGRAVAPARPVATKSYSLHYIHKRMVGVDMLSTLLVGLDWLVVQLYTLGPKRPLLYWAISSTSSQTGAQVLPMNLISFWSCKNGWIDDWSCTVRAFFAHRSHASPLYVGLLLFFLSIATCI
jgi:hypothetical protein